MMTIYNKLFNAAFYDAPDPVKQLMFYLPIEVKLGGRTFRETYNFIKSTEFLPKEKLLKIQEKLLKKILMYAVSKVPFYKRLGINISTSDNAFKIIKKFPFIDKDFMKENMNQFLSTDINSLNVYYTSTGGTSGKQFSFYINKDAFAKEWAFMIRLWERAGYKPGDKVITFRGVKIKGVSRGIYWQVQPLYNALEMSPIHLNYETAYTYIKKITEWKPKFLHGYPSAITFLAKLVKELNFEKFPRLKAILLTSENIYPWQRKIIENVFNTKVFSWYGQTEKVILAGECIYSHVYHAFPQYGFLELIDKDGELIDDHEEGELIGTGFLNIVMPFIRYRTGDYAKLANNQYCRCGRNYILLEYIKGHRYFEDLIVGKRGIFNLSSVIAGIHSDIFDNCERYQFYQDTPGKLTIKIVPIIGKFTSDDIKRIESEFKDRVGKELDIELDLSGDVYVSPSGKIPLIVQKLNVNNYIEEIRTTTYK